jgi:hypothetical protein
MDTVFAINIAPNKDAGDNKLRRRLEPMALSSNVLNCWRNRVSQSLYVAAFIHDQVFFFFFFAIMMSVVTPAPLLDRNVFIIFYLIHIRNLFAFFFSIRK